VAGFGAARSVDAALAAVPPETASVARRLVAALAACGLLVEVSDTGSVAEDVDAVLSQWEPHDLLLHEHSRTKRTDRGRGGTYRFTGVRHAPAALAVDLGSPAIVFERPDLDALRGADSALAQLMEARASRRDLGPIDAARLGDFLYRTARVRGIIPGGDDPGAYDRLDRPHPSAGGMHELTTYVAIGDCPPLEPGIYRYDGVGHGLDLVAPAGPDLDRLLRDAAAASLGTSIPPLVIIIAADFTRLSWKYEGIAYASMLKNVGVLFMSMQLVATAMGLGSCPLGGGDSELFARAIGSDWLHHTSVGEFLLGS
jgi:SagB-type dehydrogenase family enzyme